MNGFQRVASLLAGGQPDRLPIMPITMMFAADLIGAPYHGYATDHRVLVEGQLRIAELFGFDHVSCISDPAREAADCGAAVRFFDDQPPAVIEEEALLSNRTDLISLSLPDPHGGGRMTDRILAASMFREHVGGRLLIEGWVEGPLAEAADLRGINRLMLDLYEDVTFVEDLLDFTTDLGLRFARAQIEAGVDIIGIGDAAASLVGPVNYERTVWPHEKRLVDGIHALGGKVRLHICGDTRPLLRKMGELGCEIVDLDWMVPLDKARAAMGPDQVLLGNINPLRSLMRGTPETVREAIAECHRQAGSKYILGAGCEVARGTPPDNLLALLEYAQSADPRQGGMESE